jgi:hypothetical protein
VVDNELAGRIVRDAWELSGALDNDGWCDFNTMAMWMDSDHFDQSGAPAVRKEMVGLEADTAMNMDANANTMRNI